MVGWIGDTWAIRRDARDGPAVPDRRAHPVAVLGRSSSRDIEQVWRPPAAWPRSRTDAGRAGAAAARPQAVEVATAGAGALRRRPRRRRGRDRRPARHQRRRQVDAAQAIAGVVEADRGAVVLDGRDITHAPPHEIAALGVAQVPGGSGVFPSLTVDENLELALAGGPTGDGPSGDRRALELFPSLAAHRRAAGDLSGGQQQMLALGMAFVARPKLLLIDELSLGLAPTVVAELLEVVAERLRTGPRSCSSSSR